MGLGRNILKRTDVRASFAQRPAPTAYWCDVARVTIGMLPDVALLKLFGFYVNEACVVKGWHTLVHVCRKWRNVVFGSPRRLDLRLYCKARTPVREMLDVWPPLPIIVMGEADEILGEDNVVAALEHNDRICKFELWRVPSSQWEKILAAMQQPFPALTLIQLSLNDDTTPVIPASFLGGSAPSLQDVYICGLPFPGLPKLLLSATHLVTLELWRIPHSGYFSPETIVACLSMLTRLEKLGIRFRSPRSRPDDRRPPPQTRTLLSVLAELEFFGASEYLEDLVARIDAPLLKKMVIIFFHQLIFHTPQLTQFIGRTPNFKAHDEARVFFVTWHVSVQLLMKFDGKLELRISSEQADWLVSALAQVCSSSFPQALIPTVERLYIFEYDFSRVRWQDDIESSQWLELLHPFTGVKDLYISQEFMPRLAPALKELVGERVTEVLPALQTLFLEGSLPSGPVQEAIEQFVAARYLAGLPVAMSLWERDGSGFDGRGTLTFRASKD